MLNKSGGIETDLTVACLDTDYFRIVTSAAGRVHDKHHILKHLNPKVEFKDVTEDYACLGVFGPKSRHLLTEVAGDHFKTRDFPFATGKNITIHNIKLALYLKSLGFTSTEATEDIQPDIQPDSLLYYLNQVNDFHDPSNNLADILKNFLNNHQPYFSKSTQSYIFLQKKVQSRQKSQVQYHVLKIFESPLKNKRKPLPELLAQNHQFYPALLFQ